MYVIYHIVSTMRVGPTEHGHPSTTSAKTYKTRGHAQRTCRKFNIQTGRPVDEYAVATVEAYNSHVVKMVKRVNRLTGKEYEEPSNTPGYCSPSSESYWSS